jgi:exonuclease VII small subunit
MHWLKEYKLYSECNGKLSKPNKQVVNATKKREKDKNEFNSAGYAYSEDDEYKPP